MNFTARRLSLALGLLLFAGATPQAQSISRIEITPYREFFGMMPGFPTSYAFNVLVEGVGHFLHFERPQLLDDYEAFMVPPSWSDQSSNSARSASA